MTMLKFGALRTVGMLLLALLPAFAAYGAGLQPQIVLLPTVVPVGQNFYAIVYLHGNRYASGFRASALQSGDVLTAAFDATCISMPCRAQDAGFWPYFLPMPALTAGHYTLRINGSDEPAPVQFALPVDGHTAVEPLQQLAITPAPPRAGQAFGVDGYFLVLAYPYAVGYAIDAISVSGNTITAPMAPQACGFGECPPEPSYGAYHLNVPALAPGNYTLKFVDALAPGTVYAQFPLAVAASDPTPALGTAGIGVLLLLVMRVAFARLHRRG